MCNYKIKEDTSSAHEKLKLTMLCMSSTHRINHGVHIHYIPGSGDPLHRFEVPFCGYLILIDEVFYIYKSTWNCNVDIDVVAYADGTTKEPYRIEKWWLALHIQQEAKRLGFVAE